MTPMDPLADAVRQRGIVGRMLRIAPTVAKVAADPAVVGSRRPPAPRPGRLLLLRPPKSQFSACRPPHRRLGQRQRTELAVRTTATRFAAIGLRDLVAQHTVSAGIRLLTAATDAKVDHAPAHLPPLPQVLPQLPPTPTEGPSRSSVKPAFRLCTQVSCQTGKLSSSTKSKTTPKSSSPTASMLTLQNTTLSQTQLLGFNTRFVPIHVYYSLDLRRSRPTHSVPAVLSSLTDASSPLVAMLPLHSSTRP